MQANKLASKYAGTHLFFSLGVGELDSDGFDARLTRCNLGGKYSGVVIDRAGVNQQPLRKPKECSRRVW